MALPGPPDPVLGLPTAAQTAARWLPRVSVLETATVAVLLGNRASAGVEEVASLVGPLHGTAYLVTIGCAWLATTSRRARLLALVPAVGGLLALRAQRGPAAPPDPALRLVLDVDDPGARERLLAVLRYDDLDPAVRPDGSVEVAVPDGAGAAFASRVNVRALGGGVVLSRLELRRPGVPG